MQINSNFQEVLGPLGTKFTLHKCGAKYYPPKRIRKVTLPRHMSQLDKKNNKTLNKKLHVIVCDILLYNLYTA